MTIKKNRFKKICDMGTCKNMAGYSVDYKGSGDFGSIDICEDCLRELGSQINMMPEEKINETKRQRKN